LRRECSLIVHQKFRSNKSILVTSLLVVKSLKNAYCQPQQIRQTQFRIGTIFEAGHFADPVSQRNEALVFMQLDCVAVMAQDYYLECFKALDEQALSFI